MIVAAAENVLACHEHLFDGGGHAALEKNRRTCFAKRAQ